MSVHMRYEAVGRRHDAGGRMQETGGRRSLLQPQCLRKTNLLLLSPGLLSLSPLEETLLDFSM